MAQVDFSHAVLDVIPGKLPMNASFYMGMNFPTLFYYYNGNYYSAVANSSCSILTNTPTKVSILYSGTFDHSDTEFYIANPQFWKVSNITYSSGDTYSFIIDIETSGNT